MPIYLDNAATTAVLPEAATAALDAMISNYGNPSSRHRLGLEAATAVATHRKQIANTLACLPEEILFTSGGTEADHWAIQVAVQAGRRHGRHLITSAVEHAAVLEPLRALEKEGYCVTYLQPDRHGRIAPEQVKEALREDTILVSMMLVNNESGILFPLKEIATILQRSSSNALLHSDAVQGFLKLPLSPADLGVDLLSLSAHKVGGMKGSGALYVKKGVKCPPLLRGGGQESGLRSGTEATPQIAAFATACDCIAPFLTERITQISSLKAYALSQLQALIPGLVVVSPGDAPHICAISLPGYPSEMLVRDLSDRDIFVSSGSACHRGKPSHVFAAMKLSPKVLKGVLRLSFSHDNTKEDIDALCRALLEITRTRIPSR